MRRTMLSSEDSARVLDNILFAKRLARQFYEERVGLGVEREEFEGAALLGLCDAARRYDPARGIHFHTFSYLRIRGAMFDLLRRGGWIPRKHLDDLIDRTIDGNHAPPAIEDSSKVKSESKRKLPFVFANKVTDLAALAAVIEETGVKIHLAAERDELDLSYSQQQSPEGAAVSRSTARFLKRMIGRLSEKEQLVIELRYYEGSSFSEMSQRFDGASKGWISRLHMRALDNLRLAIGEEISRCELRMMRQAA